MNNINKDIFKAIHEGKWLSIEYKNKDENITKYWIGIKNIDLRHKSLIVEGLHLSKYTLCELNIYIDSLLSSAVIEASYYEVNNRLVDDIRLSPYKYQEIFKHTANLKILNYLIDCNRHKRDCEDDIYELVEYVKTNGDSTVTEKTTVSRALGVKPYSTETKEAFLCSLNFALDNILYNNKKCTIHKEVSIAHVFQDSTIHKDLFYTGRFDFVVYERTYDKREIPILAIELDGREHIENEAVLERDRKKNEICRQHGFELIRIENTYARRYNYIKGILIDYFARVVHG